jgi:uncharacterized protein (DUF58 family)
VRVAGTVEDVERFSKRTVRATKQHSEDCKTLLRLMGVPVIDVSHSHRVYKGRAGRRSPPRRCVAEVY